MTSGRCYTTGANVIALCILLITMADVIAIIVADVVTTFIFIILYMVGVIAIHMWQMLLPLRLMLLPTISVFHG